MARLRVVVLNPGEFCFTDSAVVIYTLLGSCVSITLWHPKHKIGGMCHYMLPGRGRRGADGSTELDGRYADEALHMFRYEVDRRGTKPWEYEVNMFGGGNQFPNIASSAPLRVSQDNVVVGLRLIKEHGFTLRSRHLGGVGYRRLSFDVSTGAVRLSFGNGASAGTSA